MSQFKYDYMREKHVIKYVGGSEVLEAAKAQVEALELPPCPFCGSEAVVVLGQMYGSPVASVECSHCHVRTVPIGPGYDYLAQEVRTMQDSICGVARRWTMRTEAAT